MTEVKREECIKVIADKVLFEDNKENVIDCSPNQI